MSTTVDRDERGMLVIRVPATEHAGEWVRRHLEGLDLGFDDETVERLKLVATELVTNSVIHSGAREAGGEIVVMVRTTAPTLLLKVCDRGPGVKQTSVEEADPMAENGRGLFLVQCVSEHWGGSQVQIDGSPWACVWACFGAQALPCREAG